MLGDQDENGVYNHKISIDLPKGLEGGYYLARPELLALHSAVANPPDPQFYTGCAQIFLQSTGNKHPQDTVSIPGYIKSTDASVTFNIYKEPLELPYLTPGPPVAALVSGGATAAEARQGTQQEGLQPDGCIMEMAGFCAYEVPSYTDETGCWAVSHAFHPNLRFPPLTVQSSPEKSAGLSTRSAGTTRRPFPLVATPGALFGVTSVRTSTTTAMQRISTGHPTQTRC